MNIIKIRGLEVVCRHGVHDFEKTEPHPFVFDADIQTDFYQAAKYDDLEKTVNYSRICAAITEIAQNNIFNLIEKLAYECAFDIMDKFPAVTGAELTVWKPEAPMKRKFDNVGVTVKIKREDCYLSLGSSMGDRKAYLDTAIKMLGKTRGITVKKVSGYLKTQPYGGVAENEFLNCAACISTYLTPWQLLDEIHRIEEECGRVRTKRWADRTLDIDIIFYGNLTVSDERLTIPHADYMNRDFVKIPLKSIAPYLIK